MNNNNPKYSFIKDKRFWLVLTTGFVLRFWDIGNIPFTHDEFSALFRLDFKTLKDFIEGGIKHDTHPAFTQTFLWVWTGLFGTKEWVVKLPFLIAGTASIVLIAAIGRQWFSTETGLYSAAVFSVLQSAVFHSQTARPYAIGLFFLLLAVWAHNNMLLSDKKRYPVLLSLSLLICATTHYFSLLSAGLFYMMALLITPKNKIRQLLLCGGISILLFVPHIQITLHQLSKGGIGTVLSAPDEHFFSNYILLTFHHSLIFLVAITAVVIFININHFRNFRSIRKYFIFSLLLFLMPIVTGAIYSHLRNPVLMERSLYFTLPFLLFPVMAFTGKWRHEIVNYIIICILIGSGVYSLTIERKHYEITYRSGYDNILKKGFEEFQSNKSIVFISGVPEYLNYTCSKLNIPNDFFILLPDSISAEFISEKTINNKSEKICLGRTMQYFVPDPIFDKTIIDKGYYLESQYNYFNADFRIYHSGIGNNALVDKSEWPADTIGWEFQAERIDNTGALQFLPEQEFGLAFSEIMDLTYYAHPNRELIVSAKADGTFPAGTEVVISIQHKNQSIYYSGKKADKDSEELSIGLRLCDIDPWHNDFVLRAYIWNKSGGNFSVAKMQRLILPGNPLQYSITEPIYYDR